MKLTNCAGNGNYFLGEGYSLYILQRNLVFTIMYKLQIGSGFSSQLLTGCILIDFLFLFFL